MKQKWTIEASIIAIGIVIMGICLKCGIDNFAERGRNVTVKGLAEIQVPANKVTWPIVYKELGNDLPELYNRINRTNGTIVEFLKSNGVTDEQISINAPSVVDQKADSYSSENKEFRYNVTSVIIVTSNEVDKIIKLIKSQSKLLQQGIAILAGDYNYPIVYDYTDLNKIKPAMIETATKNARLAAEQFAKDSQSNLGKIVQASQGQFSIENRDNNTPNIKNIRVVTSVCYALKD